MTVGEIWGSRAKDSPKLQLASVGMSHPWSSAGTRALTEDWLRGSLVDRRRFMAVSGSVLAGAVSAYLADELPTAQAEPSGHVERDLLIDQIETSIPKLQRLDDAKGGASSLGYVGAQLRAVALVLHEDRYSAAASRRLLAAFADLSQLAGWMAFDANDHGLAQRYLFTGLRAAYEVGYTAMAAHILADLSFQAAARGQRSDGVVLGEAACRQAARSSSGVRASVTSRLAFAYAAADDIDRFDRARAEAADALAARHADDDPSWLYYLTPAHLDCQAGYALVLAGREHHAAGDGAGLGMLRRGTAMLCTGAHNISAEDRTSQRRALYEGAWLCLAYAAFGDVESACAEARIAIGRLGTVNSPRSNTLLRELAVDFRRRLRNHHVAELLPELERALAASTPGARAS
ncbi:MAG TPA: hypothetical protein VFQ44_31015 [Streptosporangiaceae bacterium]|nr:hypothetical protein [Streptosporangiaceae bacterium]